VHHDEQSWEQLLQQVCHAPQHGAYIAASVVLAFFPGWWAFPCVKKRFMGVIFSSNSSLVACA